MARINDAAPIPKKEIRIYQETIEDMRFNSLLIDYFKFLEKAINEGYQIIFITINEEAINIEDVTHAKNLINKLGSIKQYKIL